MHETNANVIACKIASWKSSMRISKNRNKTIVIHDYSSIILAINFRLRETENFVATCRNCWECVGIARRQEESVCNVADTASTGREFLCVRVGGWVSALVGGVLTFSDESGGNSRHLSSKAALESHSHRLIQLNWTELVLITTNCQLVHVLFRSVLSLRYKRALTVIASPHSLIRNGSVPTQLAQCSFRRLDIFNARI